MQRRASWAEKGCKAAGNGIVGLRKQMIGLEGTGLAEPEIGNLREDLAFAGNAVGHDAVKGGNAVGGDKEEAVAQIEHLADLAAFKFADAGQIKLQKRFVQHNGKY